MFAGLHQWLAAACERPSARPWLYAISFSESIFFPIPTDLALAPVIAKQPRRWVSIVVWCTLYSVFGALAGYAIAMLFWDFIASSWLSQQTIAQVQNISQELSTEGSILVFLSAITPIPYKLCALSAGIVSLPLPAFVGASIIGRGLRYAVIGYFVFRFRHHWRELFRLYIEPIGWLILALLILYLIVAYV